MEEVNPKIMTSILEIKKPRNLRGLYFIKKLYSYKSKPI